MKKEKKMFKTPICSRQYKNHEYNWKKLSLKVSN